MTTPGRLSCLPEQAIGYALAIEARRGNLRLTFRPHADGKHLAFIVENLATGVTRERVVQADRAAFALDFFALAFEVGP